MPKFRLINTDKVTRLANELSRTGSIVEWISLNDLKDLLSQFEFPFVTEDVITAFETWIPSKAEYKVVKDRQTIIFIKITEGSLFSSILMSTTKAIKFDLHFDRKEATLRLVWENRSSLPSLSSSSSKQS